MRIVAGTLKGRILKSPKDSAIRPTSDKIRGAVFNALEARDVVQGAYVLDCFCGTGALGLEALSRGAAHCEFWDRDQASLRLAKENVAACDMADKSAFHLKDATRVKSGSRDAKPSLIFLDPPYRKYDLNIVLTHIIDVLDVGGPVVCVVEAEKSYEPILGSSYEVFSHKIYGDTAIVMALYDPSS